MAVQMLPLILPLIPAGSLPFYRTLGAAGGILRPERS
jgi:hypothetical protein